MPDRFFALSPRDRRDALNVAATRSSRPAHLLEKDAWVVWTLEVLFGAPFANALVFKGPLLGERMRAEGLIAAVSLDADTVRIAYDAQTAGSGYVRPVVVLEFGARSTGEPCERRDVTCDAAPHLPDVIFPVAAPSVMRPERTFWEKATAIHVFCRGGRFRGAERFSRHWYDIVALDRAAFVDPAINDRELARRVARHKSMFFREHDGQGHTIDYQAAVHGALQLVPDGSAERLLAEDYAGMVNDGLFFDEALSFPDLLAHCAAIQRRVNRA